MRRKTESHEASDMRPDIDLKRPEDPQYKSDNWRISLLEAMIASREADIREDILFRQSRGQFHVASAGHEAVAGLVRLMRPEDWIYSHYRDRALMLARGVSLYEIALAYFAKSQSSSGGRQMVSHFSSKALNIASSATPTGLQCLPAAGTAWGMKQRGKDNVVFCFIGDASTRQGEFMEAVAFAVQERLPIAFVVEDNGYGISTPTARLTPLGLGLLSPDLIYAADGRNPLRLVNDVSGLIADVRNGKGPKILWLHLDRLSSHTASDDHAKYRKPDELHAMSLRDPITLTQDALLAEGGISQEEISDIRARIKLEVKEAYLAAEMAREPDQACVTDHIHSSIAAHKDRQVLNMEGFAAETAEWTMAAAVNRTLDVLLRENRNVLMLGEDIEDPKGGVFGLTKGLSSRYPGRVINSPLAEATIAGTASGLAMMGYLPIFELQFVDFIGPAFNQIVNQIATLRWRSAGEFKCPLVLYAPCGSYIEGGGPWHSQTNESWLAHAPGIKVFMPSNANDAARLLYSAAYGEDPVIILLPKNQFQKRVGIERERHIHAERARIKRAGDHLTLVAWGNCVDLALTAAKELDMENISVEVLDLCSLVPCDWSAIYNSVMKTGRLVVIQEDNKTCSFGQAILSEICMARSSWGRLHSPPQLVSRGDVHIGFNRTLEKSVLPSVADIVRCAKSTMGHVNE